MHFTVTADTDIGIAKETNQDSVLFKHGTYSGGEVLMAVICDGMGGLAKGELASATVIRKIGTDFDNDVTNINNMITYCSSYYSSGLKGRKKSISSDIDSEKEKYDSYDTKINSSKTNLQNESNRCQTRIDILNSEISSLDSQIRTAEYNEEQARKKAWEEYLASLKGGKTK